MNFVSLFEWPPAGRGRPTAGRNNISILPLLTLSPLLFNLMESSNLICADRVDIDSNILMNFACIRKSTGERAPLLLVVFTLHSMSQPCHLAAPKILNMAQLASGLLPPSLSRNSETRARLAPRWARAAVAGYECTFKYFRSHAMNPEVALHEFRDHVSAWVYRHQTFVTWLPIRTNDRPALVAVTSRYLRTYTSLSRSLASLTASSVTVALSSIPRADIEINSREWFSRSLADSRFQRLHAYTFLLLLLLRFGVRASERTNA